jgi:putative tryptophan/tyrosine transport system substrate-binding protein
MHRRAFIAAIGLVGLVAPRPVRGQRASAGARVGFLNNSNPTDGGALVDAFRQGMAELGWVEGRNLVIDIRWAESDLSRHPRLVGDLIASRADVIVVAGSSASRAAVQATRTVPIVAAVLGDPDTQGIVTSLARPGGNITGLAWQSSDLVTKQIQILQDAIPRLVRLVALWHTANVSVRRAAETAARALGLQLIVVEVRGPGDIGPAFASAQRERAEAVIVLPSPMFYGERRRLADLAGRHRLPAVYEVKAYVDDGGLVSYGPSFPEMYRRAASHVDRILKGARPGDLPMEQPTKFELAINVKAARALGLSLPPALLLRADHTIE